MIKNNQKNGTKALGLALMMSAGVFVMSSTAIRAEAVSATSVSYSFTLDAAVKGGVDAISLTPAQVYDDAKGYGFTSIKDGNEQALAVKVVPGDYRVRVTLGNKKAASRTSIWAEDRRLMMAPVTLKKGETKTVEFIVNVRNASLATAEQDVAKAPKVGLRGDEATESRTWDDKLTVAFSGSAPAVQAVEIVPVQARRVFMAGDSTVSDQGGTDYASWGQMLPRFLKGDVSVANHARSGETMKSFVTSLRWDKLLSEARAGDVLLIQFGHNDQKKQWPRTYVSAEQSYPAWLKAFAADAQAHGMKVVLISSVSRRTFKDGKITNTLAGYDDAVRKVATELNVPFIDLTAKTATFYEALGPDISPQAFGNGGKDGTHHNAYGAFVIANYVASAITDPQSELDLKAAPDFVAFDPSKPADPQNFELKPTDWPIMREVVTKISGN